MFEGVTYSSLAIINKEELLGEWQVFKRAVFQEKKVMMEKNTSPPPSLQDIKDTMETSDACMLPETFKMMNIFLALPIGTASVERSSSHLMIKTRLCSRPSDCSVAQLMRVSIEGSEIDAVEFEEILDIFKEHNHRILL